MSFDGGSQAVGRLAAQRYLLASLLGAVGLLGVLAAVLLALQKVDALPPPQFSNSLCMDEKLHAMREHPPQTPNLLIVGSSVAWRHFNSPVAVTAAPWLRPYNAGFCGANIDQSEMIANWLVQRLPSVREVVLIASPIDFDECQVGDPSHFEIASADEYVFGRTLPIQFYARYFDPITLLKNARTVRSSGRDIHSFDSLIIDRFGDGPVEPPKSRGLFYGKVKRLDGNCFRALRRLARRLKTQGRNFSVVMTPLHPAWRLKFGGRAGTLAQLDATVRSALSGTRARLLALESAPPPSSFIDAIHIRWSATGAFTREIVKAIAPERVPIHNLQTRSGPWHSKDLAKSITPKSGEPGIRKEL